MMKKEERQKKLLARARERMCELHQAAAGLFLQQTVQADLAAHGELGEDEAVEVTEDDEGTLVVRTITVR